MFHLSEEHLDVAREIAVRNRTKQRCNRCYDRGYIGVTEENLLVVCPKCVDMEKTEAEWKEYVKEHEELHERFADLLNEKKDDTGEE